MGRNTEPRSNRLFGTSPSGMRHDSKRHDSKTMPQAWSQSGPNRVKLLSRYHASPISEHGRHKPKRWSDPERNDTKQAGCKQGQFQHEPQLDPGVSRRQQRQRAQQTRRLTPPTALLSGAGNKPHQFLSANFLLLIRPIAASDCVIRKQRDPDLRERSWRGPCRKTGHGAYCRSATRGASG